MAEFALSDEHQAVQEAVHKFAATEMRPQARAWESAGQVPASVREQIQQLGFVSTGASAGGEADERDPLTEAVLTEELAWADAGAALSLLSPAWADALARRAGFPASALSAGPGTIAQLDGTAAPGEALPGPVVASLDEGEQGGWQLTGRKVLVPAPEARDPAWMLVSAGYGLFLVPGDAAGVTWEDEGAHLGCLACPTRTLTLEAVALPREHGILAEDPRGWARLWEPYRCGIAAIALGITRAAYEYSCDYAVEREAFGQPIAKFQSIAFMLANMVVDIEASRLLLHRAATHTSAGRATVAGPDSERETLMALRHVSDAALRVTEDAVQILGGHGYCQDHPVEMWMRDARTVTLYGGQAPHLDAQLAAVLPAA